MPRLLLPFLATVAVITITPGPDMALALRNGTRDGPRAAWRTGVGCCIGIAIHASAAVLGLSALLAVSDVAYTVVRLAGAAYLVHLGVRALRPHPQAGPDVETRAGGHVRQGLVCNLLNPKIALLFLTLLPQFVADGEPRAQTSAILAATFLCIGLAWWGVFSLAVGAVGRLVARPRVARGLECCTGIVLIVLGLRVALTRS